MVKAGTAAALGEAKVARVKNDTRDRLTAEVTVAATAGAR